MQRSVQRKALVLQGSAYPSEESSRGSPADSLYQITCFDTHGISARPYCQTSTYERHDRNPLIRSALPENNQKPTGAVLVGFGQVGQPQRCPVSRETRHLRGFSDVARWKGPHGRKRRSLLALWVHGSSSWPTVTKDGFGAVGVISFFLIRKCLNLFASHRASRSSAASGISTICISSPSESIQSTKKRKSSLLHRKLRRLTRRCGSPWRMAARIRFPSRS